MKKFILAAVFLLAVLPNVFAQIPPPPPPPRPAPKISETLVKNLEQVTDKNEVSRERREQAYSKLLEGQRYVWKINRSRLPEEIAVSARLARQSFQKAVELNPLLAEGYTALAELSWYAPPHDIDESILLANIAVKIDKNNFGGHYILAQLYTLKSQLNRSVLDQSLAQKAINEWLEIARLDSRNAEAYAFLSEFYARANKPEERIAALRSWVASSVPLNNGFYGRVFQRESLAPESALLKLGEALTKAKQTGEAIEILSRAVADEPDNEEAVELLREAVESADDNSAAVAVQALQQAVYAHQENTSLIVLLAQVEARAGKIDEAAKVLRDASGKLADKDKNSAADLNVALGDLYFEKSRFDDSVKAYENALTTRGITQAEAITDDERDFAIRVFDKLIETYKKANRPNDAKAVIDRARIVLGKADLFADKRLISFYQETGKKPEALQAVRALRARNADDYSLIRLEATLLSENGKVDEAVALIKSLIGKKTSPVNASGNGQGSGIGAGTVVVASPMNDDFINYLFIANLYAQAKRGTEATDAVNQALAAAQNADRKEIARITLASVQQTAGDFKGAETTLRGILKESPQNATALNNLGYFLTERGENLTEALDLITKAVELEPRNPSFLDSLGWIYFKLGKLGEAEKFLKNALEIDDSSTTIQEHLGDVYQKQNKADLAKAAWQKSLTLASDAEDISRLKAKLNVKVTK